jgi:micrococcal nuclease
LARIDSVERCEPGFQAAKDHMALLVRGKEVRCVVRGRERYGRLLAECGTDETPNLSDEILRTGLAKTYRRKR